MHHTHFCSFLHRKHCGIKSIRWLYCYLYLLFKCQYDIKAIFGPLIDKNLENIAIFFLDSCANPEFVTLFTKVFKLILKILPNVAQKYFSLLFTTTFKMFQVNPKQNSGVLSVFSFTISILDTDPGFGVWLKENYSEFNQFLISTVNQYKDPDLIKNFTNLQSKIMLYNDLIFLECAEYGEILRVLLESLLTIKEYSMTKEILLFFNSFMGLPKGLNHPNVLKILPDLIKTLIFLLPDISRNFLIYEIHVFQALIKSYGKGNNELFAFIRESLNNEKFVEVNEKQKVLIFLSFFHFFYKFTNFLINS